MKNLKKIGEGLTSQAFISDDKYILLVGKRKDSFKNYEDIKQNMDLLEGKINSVKIPSNLTLIKPCEKYPFGALNYLAVRGKKLNVKNCTLEEKKKIGKKLANFLWELHNLKFEKRHNNKDWIIKHEKNKVAKSLQLLEPYFNKEENNHLKQLEKQRKQFYLESDFCVTHGDLHEENLLVDENNQLVGIIDFGNMAYYPPICDFATIYYEVDEEIFKATIENYPNQIDLNQIKLCNYFRNITLFAYIQNKNKEELKASSSHQKYGCF